MKSVSKLSLVLIVYLIEGSYSLPNETFKSVYARSVYGYEPSSGNREIATGQTLSLDPNEIDDASNWSTNTPGVQFISNGIYLRAIEFEEEFMNDGSADGQITLQEAITTVKNYYVTNGDLENDNECTTLYCASSLCTPICIRRSNSN